MRYHDSMQFVIGVDEVGRGPLAGPIAIGVVAMPIELNDWRLWEGLKDSKKLTEKKREEWFLRVKADSRLEWHVSSSGARIIDTKGIVGAAKDASVRAIGKISYTPDEAHVVLDHGLSVSEEWIQEQFIKGDENIPVIALASIMAKVTRDRYMVQLAEEHPLYGFESHKGYGSKRHQEAILLHGPIAGIHRKLFIRNLLK